MARLALLLAVTTAAPALAGNIPDWRAASHSPAPRIWKGENGWIIIYRPDGRVGSCTMFNGGQHTDHMVFWKWDRTMLMFGYGGPRPTGARPDAVSTLVVSVDGKLLLAWHVSYLDVIDLKNIGPSLVVLPRRLSWDVNSEGHDTGLETGAIFDLLRQGHTLTIKTFGKTYFINLRGVGSALALFPACIHYKDFPFST